MPIDYSKSKIYKIVDLDTDECYIGSTCEPTLARRLAGHVGNYKKYKNGKYGYVTSFKIIEKENYDIQLIENYPCVSKDELHAREGYWIRNNECVNKIINGRTKRQWETDNKEKIAERKRQYRLDNKEKLLKYEKDYRESNRETISFKKGGKCICNCGGRFTHSNKSQHERTVKHQNFINTNREQ